MCDSMYVGGPDSFADLTGELAFSPVDNVAAPNEPGHRVLACADRLLRISPKPV